MDSSAIFLSVCDQFLYWTLDALAAAGLWNCAKSVQKQSSELRPVVETVGLIGSDALGSLNVIYCIHSNSQRRSFSSHSSFDCFAGENSYGQHTSWKSIIERIRDCIFIIKWWRV